MEPSWYSPASAARLVSKVWCRGIRPWSGRAVQVSAAVGGERWVAADLDHSFKNQTGSVVRSVKT
jgi:hypothetical protein